MTIIDFSRFQRVPDRARVACRVALAVARSAGHFLGACGVLAVSGLAAYAVLGDVRKPDSALVHQAIERARSAAANDAFAVTHPSALAERDGALICLAVTIFFIGCGVVLLVEWWRSLPSIRQAAK